MLKQEYNEFTCGSCGDIVLLPEGLDFYCPCTSELNKVLKINK